MKIDKETIEAILLLLGKLISLLRYLKKEEDHEQKESEKNTKGNQKL